MKVSAVFKFRSPEIRALHLTWIAFFITFYVWFNMAPLASSMLKSVNWLTTDDLKLFAICNVALTIPARIIVGMALDRFGPRRVFSVLMVTMSLPALAFAFGNSMTQSARSTPDTEFDWRQLRGRYPHDGAVVQAQGHRLRRRLLRWLG